MTFPDFRCVGSVGRGLLLLHLFQLITYSFEIYQLLGYCFWHGKICREEFFIQFDVVVVEIWLLRELCNGLVLLKYICEQQLSFIHNVWYIKDLGGDCFLELLDWHVVEILTFIHYTHMNQVANLGRYLMCKILFRSLFFVAILEFVWGFDYCWVI